MKGTEKQITWATEIKDRVTAILTEGIEAQKLANPDNTANLKLFSEMLDVVSGFDGYAGEMISTFRNVRRNGNIQKDLLDVVYAARATRIIPTECGEFGKALRALLGLK